MKLPQDSELELDRVVQRALGDLPLRPAPPNLESRVLEELSRRAALPWWRRSYRQWPQVVRALFVGVCASLGGLTVLAGARMAWTVRPGHALERLSTIAGAAGDALSALAHAIPLAWIYEACVFAAVLYVVLFALGAAAYRTLYLEA